jgi:hypothetical protein
MCNACLDHPQLDSSGFPSVHFFVGLNELSIPNKLISLEGKASYTQKDTPYPEKALNSLQERIGDLMTQLVTVMEGDIQTTRDVLTTKWITTEEYPLETIQIDEVNP